MLDFVFIVLTYRNSEDLMHFIQSADKITETYKIIVVNSFFDEKSLEEIKKIATSNNCDFLNVENKGYGSGNNRGIEYAIQKYQFKYLVISNPDIEIVQLSTKILNNIGSGIFGPRIIRKNGRDQNPYFPYKSGIVIGLRCFYAITGIIPFYYGSILLNKLYRFIFRITGKRQVYCLHGSFLIFSSNILEDFIPLFDENIFLFAEEEYLALKAFQKNIRMYYLKELTVFHHEDGSMQFLSQKIIELERKALKTVYKL